MSGLSLHALASPAFGPDALIPSILERVFAEPSTLSEIEWDEENVVLSTRESVTNSGHIRYAVTPHTRDLRRAMADPAVRQMTIQKNDQAAITRTALNFITKLVAEDPCNILYVINSLEEARRMSDRLLTSLLACPAARAQVDPADATSEDVELQTLTFKLRDMTIYFVGGGSIGGVANKQISVIIVDEADKIPRVSAGSNTHVVDEAKSRFKSVPLGECLIVVFSKPNQETDIVHTEYKLGTMEHGRMPCPHCGHVQEFRQERLRFDHCKLPSGDYDKTRVLAETHYLCARAGTTECPDGKIADAHRHFTSENISYVATNPNPEPGHRSFHLTDFLLNPAYFPDASFGRIALDLIAGFKNPAKMKAVQAARFGLPEALQQSTLSEDSITALCSNYLRGTAPRGLAYCGIYSDLQGYGPKWVKFGFKRNGEYVIIDWGTYLAIDDLMDEAQVSIPEIDETQPIDPGQFADQPEHPEHRPARYTATGKQWFPQSGGIDEGFQQKLVHAFVVRSGFFFLPTKGRPGSHARGKSLVNPSPRDYEGQEFQAYHFNDDQFKKELYLWRIRDHQKIIDGKSKVGRMHLPIDVDQQLITELISEKLTITREKSGWLTEKWEPGPCNDFGDAVKGGLVMWHVVGPEVLAGLEPESEPVAPINTELGKLAPCPEHIGETEKRALRYLHNVGIVCTTAIFDDDHAPIGPTLRARLLQQKLTHESHGNIYPLFEAPTK